VTGDSERSVKDADSEGLRATWVEAARIARWSYDSWTATGSGDAYAVYRAAADQAEAAQDALAAARPLRWGRPARA
jgi:hypothetical protein